MAGKAYRLANNAHSGLLEACKGTTAFDGIPEAWYKRWKQIDRPVYCVAHVLMPECHAILNRPTRPGGAHMKEH